MPNPTLVVYTYRPVSRLLREGGSQNWRLNPTHARRCTYIVCTRNRFYKTATAEDQAAATEEQRSAFLVGKITTVEPSPEQPERPERYIVRFDEYALINVPDAWPTHRYPIW